MNQVKIGKFIAEMRCEQGLTQKQLAEQLNVSDKAVSKWECGKGMPDNSILLQLCSILNINVNELLSGERLPQENYHGKAEENMVSLITESEKHRKKNLWALAGTFCGGCMLLALLFFVTEFLNGGRGLYTVTWFIDSPSLLIILAITLIMMTASGSLRDFIRGFRICYGEKEFSEEEVQRSWLAMKLVLIILPLGSVLSFVMSIVTILASLMDPAALGPNCAVALLVLFYGMLIDLLLLPTAKRLRMHLMK